MTIPELLANLIQLGVQLQVEDDRLTIRAPKGVLAPEHRTALSQSKEEILALLRRNNGDTFSLYPLSHGQKALWFLYQLDSKSTAYNIMTAVCIRSELHILALQAAFQTLLDRHPCLRTTFTEINGEPAQVVHEHVKTHFEVIEASTWDQDDLNNYMNQIADQPFDLEQGPVVRVKLFVRSPEEHILLLTVHHIIFDLWSFDILLNELQHLYLVKKKGIPESLSPLTLQYSDYVRWQSEMLAGPEGERLWAYWQQQLAGELPTLNLPTDRPRPPVQSYSGASSTPVTLDANLTQRLKRLAQAEATTLYTIFLAAFQILLYRYTAQDDILVGTPLAGRSRIEFERIVGYFVNPVVIRANFSGDPTFKAFLAQVRQTALAALEYGDYPFPLLVEQLHPSRDLSRSPLFQVAFIWDKPHRSESGDGAQFGSAETPAPKRLKEFHLEHIDGGQRGAQFDLLLTIIEQEASLAISWRYNTDLFDAGTITRLMDHFQVLLKGIVTNPDQCLSELPLLTESERHQLIVQWNNTHTNYPQHATIHQLFEGQVEPTPEAIAVIFENNHLTYRELNRRANQLAHHLQALGVGPEICVGLCLDRSLEMVIAHLAILKAGGAYVPLDPSYPQERLAFILQDTQMPVLLTQQRLLEVIPAYGGRVICLDSGWQAISQESEINPISGVLADNLAYVMYTSGSTGRPKGVSVSHRNVVRLVKETNYVHLTAAEVFLQFAPISFDATTLEIWGPLLNGAKLVVFPARMSSLEELSQILQRYQVSTLWLTAALFHQMVDSHLEALKGIRQLLAGGDVLSKAHVQKVLQLLPECKLINGYGPTENTTFTCCYPMTDLHQVGPSVSIGRPIANTQVYILDRNLQPVPIGVAGELYTAGAGLACGYLNRPELTAEKFIPNPFSNEPGARLYNTGDLARYLPDGNIEFLGRSDYQVKIRGFRIELGEIEAVLDNHPAVQEVVVIAREDTIGQKRLVAYLVINRRPAPAISELRHFLEEKLPNYMVPTAFVFLDKLPVSPNGKVDRRALPAPDPGRSEQEKTFAPPRTPVEEEIAQIWASILGLERVGINDNFFDLGGHSLLAIQVISRLRDTFQVHLPVGKLFETPTVADLALVIVQNLIDQENAVEKISRRPNPDALPLSFAQQRLWLLDQLDPGNSTYNIPGAFRLKGSLNVSALKQALTEILRRHEVLRTTFVNVEGQPTLRIFSPDSFKLLEIDIRGFSTAQQEIEIQRWLTEELYCPFDLAHGPLFRATLLQAAEEDYVFLIMIHHIVADGWSIGIFGRELRTLYQAFSNGQPSPLPEPAIQYVDFAYWQRQWLQGEVLQTQLNYWKQQLGREIPVLELPTDRTRPAIQSFRGSRQTLNLGKPLTAALNSLCQREGVTLFMMLLAAFKVLLFRYTRQEDILIGSITANRNRTEIEGLIGFFVNTLVLRTDLSGNPTFRELLARVRQVTLDAYNYQDLPFEKLVEELHPTRNMSHSPLFQVMFALQNTPMEAIELTGVTLTPIEFDLKVAKFDLTLDMWEKAGQLTAILEYNTDLFEPTTINRMLGHFQALLEGIVANADQPISTLPLLAASERRQLLESWNDTRVDYTHVSGQWVHQLFEAHVKNSPEAEAIVFEYKTLTYRELNNRANQLAYYLQSLGVEPETRVGICTERSPEMVVGILGILKAGGAYVPLDPAYPPERLAFMLEDAQTPILLTQQQLVEKLPKTNVDVVYLDTDWSKIALEDTTNPIDRVTAGNLAYVIYTSGSTGLPKGVQIEHCSLLNLVFWHQEAFSVLPSDRATQIAGLSFDASVWEIWPYLTAGASIHFPSEEIRISPARLLEWLISQKITIGFLPTPLAEAVLSLEWPANPALRTLLTGGDKLHHYPSPFLPFKLVNNYGPTEYTVVTTSATITPAQAADKAPTIGLPINNTQIYLLDRYLQPVPLGVTGELHIGGAGLARGYLNRPELTAEKFIPNPFSNQPGVRLYKTGDLARYRPDGTLDFLGRSDHQVKIRGFRIELGEIETLLNQHPAVQEAVVVVREEASGEKYLTAYLVIEQPSKPSIDELRNLLKEKLPHYMVPAAFVLLESLPLTPNGKVDRRALPQPDQFRPELQATYVAPQTKVEQVITTVWQDVLKLEKVGIHDNFFDLGGHSLLMVQVHSQLCNALQTDNLPIVKLFQYATVNTLARYLSQELSETSSRQNTHDRIQQQKAAIAKQKQFMKKAKKTDE